MPKTPKSKVQYAASGTRTTRIAAKSSRTAAVVPGKPPMREQVLAFKREQILTAAAELFYELGYQQTTLDRVAQHLGVTKPFIYYHFKDKAEILMEISKRGISDGNAVLRRSIEGSGSAADRLHAAVKAIMQTIIHSQRYTAIFFREQKNFDTSIRAPLEQMHREFDELLAQLLQDGVARGEFRIDDVRLCSLAVGGMVNWSYTWYRENGRLSAEALCEGMARLAVQMVGAARG